MNLPVSFEKIWCERGVKGVSGALIKIGIKDMRLETERLILRDYEKADEEAYFRLKSDCETMYYLQDIWFATKEEAAEEFGKVLQDLAGGKRQFYFFHVELKTTHEQIGSAGYTVLADTPVGKLVHAGYFFYPRFWKMGYATEAFRRVLEFAFLENNVYRVSTGCLALNIGSEKVMMKCGLIKEAERVDWEWHDGEMKTRVEYRLLRSEWEEGRRKGGLRKEEAVESDERRGVCSVR